MGHARTHAHTLAHMLAHMHYNDKSSWQMGYVQCLIYKSKGAGTQSTYDSSGMTRRAQVPERMQKCAENNMKMPTCHAVGLTSLNFK